MNAPFSITPGEIIEREPDPIEIARPCELCGCTIEDLEELIYLRAADLIAEWERADPRDCWRHTGEQPLRLVEPAPAVAQPYRTPQSVIDAFLYVATHEPAKLKAWLARHPDDVTTLHRIWKAKRCS
jgi:hypothetical protein